MSEWKPIETAPRDGTAIIAYPCDIWYSWYSCPHKIDVVHWNGEGWYLSLYDGVVSYSDSITHWMPLPDPPRLDDAD